LLGGVRRHFRPKGWWMRRWEAGSRVRRLSLGVPEWKRGRGWRGVTERAEEWV